MRPPVPFPTFLPASNAIPGEPSSVIYNSVISLKQCSRSKDHFGARGLHCISCLSRFAIRNPNQSHHQLFACQDRDTEINTLCFWRSDMGPTYQAVWLMTSGKNKLGSSMHGRIRKDIRPVRFVARDLKDMSGAVRGLNQPAM